MFSVVFQYVNLHSLTIQSIEFHIHTVVFWPPWSLCQLCLNKPLILIFSSKISRLYKNTSHKDLVLLGVNSGDQGYQKIPKKLLKTVCLNKDRPTRLVLPNLTQTKYCIICTYHFQVYIKMASGFYFFMSWKTRKTFYFHFFLRHI